jgi:hypothetical protein
VVAITLAVAVSSASAGRIDPPGHRDGNHCVNAFGVDLNNLYGISDQFRFRDCTVLSAGEHWIRPLWWITNFSADSVYPPGYVPSRPAPIDDFVAKLVAMQVVIDGGTPKARTHVFDPTQIVRTDIHAEQVEPGAWGAPYPMATLLPRLRPLSLGDHFVETSLVLSDEHCDGFSTDPHLSCLPAGEVLFFAHPVAVTKPQH